MRPRSAGHAAERWRRRSPRPKAHRSLPEARGVALLTLLHSSADIYADRSELMRGPVWRSRGSHWVVALSWLLLGNGCSTAHMDNPQHTWLPLTHHVYDGHDCCSNNCEMHPGIPQCLSGQQQFSAMETELLMPFAFLIDAIAMPCHALGHLFAESEPPAIPQPTTPTSQP